MEDLKVLILRLGALGFAVGNLAQKLVSVPVNMVLIVDNRCIKCYGKLNEYGLCPKCHKYLIERATMMVQRYKEAFSKHRMN